MVKNLKRFLIATVSILLFIAYFLATDPDTKIFQNLHYGSSLILMLGIFVIASVGLWFVEIAYDWFLDPIFGREQELVEEAKERHNQAAALVSLSKSIRILAAAIIVAASIIALNVQ